MFEGALDQYIRIVGYNLSILFLLMLSINANGVKYVLRAVAFLLAIQEITVWMRLLGYAEYVPFIQTWLLTFALWILVIVLAISILASSKIKQ